MFFWHLTMNSKTYDQQKCALCKPRYLNVFSHNTSLPLQVVIQQQWASNLRPMRMHDDFLTLTVMSSLTLFHTRPEATEVKTPREPKVKYHQRITIYWGWIWWITWQRNTPDSTSEHIADEPKRMAIYLFIKMFSILSGVKLLLWVLIEWNILCTRQVEPYYSGQKNRAKSTFYTTLTKSYALIYF